MKRKLGITLLSCAMLAVGALGFTACDFGEKDGPSDTGEQLWTMEAVYARAQELGYAGTLEEFIAQISGKDGADGEDGKDGIGISNIAVDENGELVITLSDGKQIECGNVAGKDGADGADGEDGQDGQDGTDGISVTDAKIDENGHLILTFSDDRTLDCGKVEGADGADGEDGKDGVGVKRFYFNENDELMVELTDGSTVNCGKIPECAHEYSAWEVVAEATCTSIGYETRTCTLCGDIEYRFTEALGHISKAANSEWATHSFYCDRCGQFIQGKHTYQNDVCTVCGRTAYSTGLEYRLNDDGVSYSVIGLGTFSGQDLVIPATYHDLPVTQIGEEAFAGSGAVKNIELPATITKIGKNAFASCQGLENVYLNDLAAWCEIEFYDSTSTPMYYASNLYLNGEQITDLVIPDGVTTINNYAFYNCTGLMSVTLPASVEQIEGIEISGYPWDFNENTAFGNCAGLKAVYISDLAAWCEITFDCPQANPMWYAGNLYLNGKLVTDLHVPEGTTKIGSSAFYACSSLTSITIPNSVTSIGEYAFEECSELTSIIVPDSVINIGERAFQSCSRLTSITLGNGVESIGDYAFLFCSKLTSVNVPDSVISIGERAFDSCSGIEYITLGGGIESIGNYAFAGCDGLNGVYISDLAAWYAIVFDNNYANPLSCAHNLYLNGELITDLVIPDSVTSIGDYVFYNCIGLTGGLVIPDSVTNIGNEAFWGCSELTSVTIGNGVESIGDSAFAYCSGLTSVTLGNSVESIGDSAFAYCSGLTGGLVIPDSVTSIGNEAFYGCESLISVTIPDGVESIGERAFSNCVGLTSITLGNGVNSIGRRAFDYCFSLTSVIFENPNGWIVDYSTSISGSDLSAPSIAATYLTSTYCSSDWKRN